jgi:hypothetical protein
MLLLPDLDMQRRRFQKKSQKDPGLHDKALGIGLQHLTNLQKHVLEIDNSPIRLDLSCLGEQRLALEVVV